jgi:hypothetical protein
MWVKLGHCGDVRCTTALPPKAEVDPRSCYVANVPKGDICSAAKVALLDHLVGEREKRRRYFEAERLGRLRDQRAQFRINLRSASKRAGFPAPVPQLAFVLGGARGDRATI